MSWAIFNKEQQIALDELEDIESPPSDRVLAIVSAALLEESLFRALDIRLRQNTNVKDKAFKMTGILGNLGAKIDVAYLLYMFEKPTRQSMEAIAGIRNFFAHNLVANFDSEDEKLRAHLKNLKLHEGKTYYPNPFIRGDSDQRIENVKTSREALIVNLKLCLFELLADVSRHQHGSNLPL
jgi:hypothetical protein